MGVNRVSAAARLPGGYSTKFCTGMMPPEVQTLRIFLYHREKLIISLNHPLNSDLKGTPSHISSVKNGTPSFIYLLNSKTLHP